MDRRHHLSRQEERVLDLARQGLGDKQIAVELGLSPDTVRTYWQRIRTKVGAATRAEIVATISDKKTAAALEEVETEKGVLLQEILRRTSVEKALRTSEQQWRRLADAVPSMVFISDSKGRPLYFNARFYEYTGLGVEDALSSGWIRAIHRDDVSAVAKELKLRAPEAGTAELAVRIRKLDGSYRWHMNRTVPIRNDKNEIVQWFGTSTDIHEQISKQEELQRRTAQMEFAERETNTGSFYADYRTHTIDWSQNMYGLVGRDPALGPLWGHQIRELMHEDDRARFDDGIRNLRSGVADVDGLFRFPNAMGEDRLIHIRALRHVEGETVVYSHGFLRDVTDSKRDEFQLKMSEQRFRAICEWAPIGIFLSSARGDCQFVNKRYLEITGQTSEAALGDSWIDSVHPDDRERVGCDWTEAQRKGTPQVTEFRCVRPDGTATLVKVQVFAIEVDHIVQGYVGTLQDITEAAGKESEQKRLMEILEAQFGALTKGMIPSGADSLN